MTGFMAVDTASQKNVNDKIRAHRCTNTLGLGYKAWRLPVRTEREKCQSGEQSRS